MELPSDNPCDSWEPPSDDELRRIVEETFQKWSEGNLEKEREFDAGYPDPPTEAGIYAIVAPDGVTVELIDEKVKRIHLRKAIRTDVIKRMLRDVQVAYYHAKIHPDEWMLKLLPQVSELKKRYRLEKLGNVSML